MNAAGRARAHDARGVAMNEGHTHGEIDMATVTVAKQERVRNERMGSVAFDAEGTLPRISDKVRPRRHPGLAATDRERTGRDGRGVDASVYPRAPSAEGLGKSRRPHVRRAVLIPRDLQGLGASRDTEDRSAGPSGHRAAVAGCRPRAAGGFTLLLVGVRNWALGLSGASREGQERQQTRSNQFHGAPPQEFSTAEHRDDILLPRGKVYMGYSLPSALATYPLGSTRDVDIDTILAPASAGANRAVPACRTSAYARCAPAGRRS